MTKREEAKEFNRARIRAAAEDIIRNEGMDRLTMRHLAEEAGVSLRTPYNLFGSKTDVLVALIDGARLNPDESSVAHDTVLETLLSALDRAELFFEKDEYFYRAVFREIMISDDPDVREDAVARIVNIGKFLIAQAVAQGELEGTTDTDSLGKHLAIQLTAVLGMWASGFFSNHESIAHVRRGWCGVLLNHCSDEARPFLRSTFQSTLSIES